MNREYEKIRKMISLGLILLGIIIIVVMAVNILGKGNKTKNIVQNTTTTADGGKVNTSEEVASNKTVEGVLIEKSKIVYLNGTSNLTSKVTNDGVAKDNLRFTVKFMAADGTVIAESVGYIGAIGANETRTIESQITTDVSDAKDIVYEIIK